MSMKDFWFAVADPTREQEQEIETLKAQEIDWVMELMEYVHEEYKVSFSLAPKYKVYFATITDKQAGSKGYGGSLTGRGSSVENAARECLLLFTVVLAEDMASGRPVDSDSSPRGRRKRS